MKKLSALAICLMLMLSCLSGTAMADSYKSKLLKTNIALPKQMSIVNEEKLADGSGVEFTFSVMGQDNATIYTDVQKMKDYKGYTMNTLPEEVTGSWTEYYYTYYPENATAGLLPSKDGKGDALYCYCGQSADGGSLLVYSSLKDEVYVCSYCISEAEGMAKITMQATLEALNAVNAAVFKPSPAGKAAAAGTASRVGGKSPAPVFSHNDYDTLILFLILDDDDEAPDLYDDADFDFEYVEQFEEETDDADFDWDAIGDADDAGFDLDWDLDGGDWSSDAGDFGSDDGGYDAGGYDAGGYDGGYVDYGGDWGGDDW